MTISLQNTTSTGSTFVPYKKPTPELASSYKPTHPGQLKVVLEKGKGDDGEDTYSSYLIAEQVRTELVYLGCAMIRASADSILVSIGHSCQLDHLRVTESYVRRKSVLECTIRRWA